MLSNEERAYKIAKENPNINNDDFIKKFYYEQYGIIIPTKKEALSFETITRLRRKIVETYPNLKGNKERQNEIINKIDDIKEMVVEINHHPEKVKYVENKIEGINW